MAGSTEHKNLQHQNPKVTNPVTNPAVRPQIKESVDKETPIRTEKCQPPFLGGLTQNLDVQNPTPAFEHSLTLALTQRITQCSAPPGWDLTTGTLTNLDNPR